MVVNIAKRGFFCNRVGTGLVDENVVSNDYVIRCNSEKCLCCDVAKYVHLGVYFGKKQTCLGVYSWRQIAR